MRPATRNPQAPTKEGKEPSQERSLRRAGLIPCRSSPYRILWPVSNRPHCVPIVVRGSSPGWSGIGLRGARLGERSQNFPESFSIQQKAGRFFGIARLYFRKMGKTQRRAVDRSASHMAVRGQRPPSLCALRLTASPMWPASIERERISLLPASFCKARVERGGTR